MKNQNKEYIEGFLDPNEMTGIQHKPYYKVLKSSTYVTPQGQVVGLVTVHVGSKSYISLTPTLIRQLHAMVSCPSNIPVEQKKKE